MDVIAVAGRMNGGGMFTQGIKITSITIYASSGGGSIPIMQNSYEGWNGGTMYGEKYYKGRFSADKTPMWR